MAKPSKPSTKIFRIEPHHRKLISKTTLLKFLTAIDKPKLQTPALLLDKEHIEKKMEVIGSNIANSRVFYAVKANPSPLVIKLLAKLGAGFEIASDGELALCAKAGVKPDRIITSNPIKTFKFLKAAAKYGVQYYAFDSMEEVDKIARFVPGASVYVRLSVPNEGSEWPLSKKFGVEVEEAVDLVTYAKQKGLDPCGITFHVGSQCTNVYNWDNAIYKARILWDICARKGLKFRMIDIGGGYPVSYTKSVVGIEEIEKNIDKLIKENFPPGGDGPEIFIEPGRAVVGDAGMYVTSVIGKSKRADEDWLHIDVGVFNGLMESIGGIKYSYIVEDNRKAGVHRKHWTIAGPSCDSMDVIDQNVELPEPSVGDIILLLSCGAYTLSYASEFNGFSMPDTLLV